MNKITSQILNSAGLLYRIPEEEKELFNEYQAHVDCLNEMYPEYYTKAMNVKYPETLISPNQSFTKVFDKEFDHCMDKYNLTMKEVLFCKGLSGLIGWKTNLLVSRENHPLTQEDLRRLYGKGRTQMSAMLNSLEEKHCIKSIPFNKNKYYIMNPYLMCSGSKVIGSIPELFVQEGFSPLSGLSSP